MAGQRVDTVLSCDNKKCRLHIRPDTHNQSSLIHQIVLQESFTFFFLNNSRERTLANVVHVIESEDRTPPSYAQNAWHRRTFFSCRAHLINAHARWLKGLTAEVVYCAVFLKMSFGHLMFHETLLEAQSSTPSPFSKRRSDVKTEC